MPQRVTATARLLLAGILVTWTGCPASRPSATSEPPVPDPAARHGASAKISVIFSAALSTWEWLDRGEFMFAGTVIAPAGLNPEHPLSLRVTDLDSQLALERYIAASDDAFPGTWLTLPEGAFRVDGVNDLRLAEGRKLVELTFWEEAGGSVTYSFPVEAGPLVPDLTEAERVAARGRYGMEAVRPLSSWRAVLQQLQYDPEVFPYAQWDIELLMLWEQLLLATMVSRPDRRDWPVLVETYQVRFEQHFAEDPELPVAEQEYREDLHMRMELLCDKLLELHERDIDRLWWFRGDGPPALAWDGQKSELAFLRHTFSDVVSAVAEDGAVANWTCTLRADQGTLPMSRWYQDPYVDPIPGTASSEPPKLELQILLVSDPQTRLINSLVYSGTIGGEVFPGTNDPDPLPHSGHLLTPLLVLDISPWWIPAW